MNFPERKPFAAAGRYAIEDDHVQWRGAEFEAEIDACVERLRALGIHGRLATLADNSAAWVVVDRACARAGIVHVPLPGFFTRAQVEFALRAAGADALLREKETRVGTADLEVGCRAFDLVRYAPSAASLPAGTSKITFTSGTTGTPKGVCLDESAMARVANGLEERLRPLAITRHLCALPFALLLENVAGLLAPLAAQATCVIRPLRELGVAGSSQFDPAVFDRAVRTHEPHSLVLLPQMLRAWTLWLAATKQRAAPSLRFVAVGGASVGPKLIAAARDAGVPAYEGYGLSEAASVQTLNVPGADRPGSVGRPLPHCRVRIAKNGEIEVAGSMFLGYVGERDAPASAWLPTGDIGTVDDDGFLHLQGRRKHVLITGFGRNVSPEWVETALRDEAPILQATVFGEGEPHLWAVLWPFDARVEDAALSHAVASANASLPDYARIGHWVRAVAPFTCESGLATPNGRPRRDAIARLHARSPLPVDDRPLLVHSALPR